MDAKAKMTARKRPFASVGPQESKALRICLDSLYRIQPEAVTVMSS